jgi:hypothetical protein
MVSQDDLRNLPDELRALLADLGSMDEDVQENPRGFSNGKRVIERIFGNQGPGSNAHLNVIPSVGVPGPCMPILFVAIGHSDDVTARLQEAIEHLAVKCPGRTDAVLIYALWWSSIKWAERRPSFHRLGTPVLLKMPFQQPSRLT